MKDLLEFGLDHTQQLGVKYAELRHLGKERLMLVVKNGKLDNCIAGYKGGVSIRCLSKEGGWGFATTYELTKRP